MIPAEFKARLVRHGSDFDRWPAALRADARALVVRSAAARRAYVSALDQDAALDAARLPADAAARLRVQVEAAVARAPQRRDPRQLMLRGGGLAACAAVGLLAGWLSTPPRPNPPLLFAAMELTPFTGSGE